MSPRPLQQPIQLPGILARDLAPRTSVQAAEVLLDHLERVRPDAVRVRVVRAPDDVVFAHQMRHIGESRFVLVCLGLSLCAARSHGTYLMPSIARPRPAHPNSSAAARDVVRQHLTLPWSLDSCRLVKRPCPDEPYVLGLDWLRLP